ncbi:MAG: DUF2330 domain-containing protein [Gemmataceae bacterium]
MRVRVFSLCPLAVLMFALPGTVSAACCYFSAKNTDILQPAQKVFLTHDPAEKIETFTVQPRFEGNALDFGMVIPTPALPKLHEMPKEFFKHLAIYTILKRRESPHSNLLPLFADRDSIRRPEPTSAPTAAPSATKAPSPRPEPPPVRVLETGVVGSLDYKILEADRADALFDWLKEHKYQYAGDEATLDYYVKKKWFFTVMKIDTMAMKKSRDGTYQGEVTPTRFRFASDKLIYPLKITQISVKDKTEALIYVQAPGKVDLPGDWTYQYTWLAMLQSARGCTPGGIKGGGEDWLSAINERVPALLRRARDLGFTFTPGFRPSPNREGHIPTTMEWARKLTARDIAVLKGEAPYSETVPDVDQGFNVADVRDPKRAGAVRKVIQARLARAHAERPYGYLVRHVPDEDIKGLRQLAGHFQAGQFITKFRKFFCRDEMNEDIVFQPAREGDQEDRSEYEEILPTSPP